MGILKRLIKVLLLPLFAVITPITFMIEVVLIYTIIYIITGKNYYNIEEAPHFIPILFIRFMEW